jgi:voltage-gated potassium channel
MNNPLLRLYRSKIYTAIMMLCFLLCIGVLGYRFISGYDWLDAIYMTVITVTTVGFAEVNPLDTGSKIFTIFLILASVVIVGYAISIITEYILSKNNFEDIKEN